MIRIYQEADYAAMSLRAAHVIAAEVYKNPACVLSLATGSTPVGTYKKLAEWVQNGELSFKEVQTVNLDEYKGLAPTHDQSYRYFMEDNLFNHIDIDLAKTHVPSGLTEDAEAECRAYDELVASLGYADLQLLGLGCIMAARRVLLIANGEGKADALYKAFCGPITPECPASILQLHNDVVVIGDEASLSKLVAAGVEVYK